MYSKWQDIEEQENILPHLSGQIKIVKQSAVTYNWVYFRQHISNGKFITQKLKQFKNNILILE